MTRKKTSISLDEKIWNDFQTHALRKHGNVHNANTELEFDMRVYLKNHPLGKKSACKSQNISNYELELGK